MIIDKKKYVIAGMIIVAVMMSISLLNDRQLEVPLDVALDKREALALQFLEREFVVSGGVRTTYHQTPYTEDVATGAEVLSESQGLLMLYYALSGEKEKFNNVYEYLNTNLKEYNLYVYREDFSVNALIDDLRIIEALIVASEIFNQSIYLKEAKAYAKHLQETNVVANNWFDFYDIEYDITNDFITLGYLNFEIIDWITTFVGVKTEKNSPEINLVKAGYLGNEFPFYQSRYYYKTNCYETDKIHISEGLMPVYHLAKVNEVKEETIMWLAQKVSTSSLYGLYDTSGVAQNKVESTASYAIVAQIAALIKDEKLYQASIAQMERFQVLEKSSPLYGGFATTSTQEAYSFDQLMALLAYRYGDLYLQNK